MCASSWGFSVAALSENKPPYEMQKQRGKAHKYMYIYMSIYIYIFTVACVDGGTWDSTSETLMRTLLGQG